MCCAIRKDESVEHLGDEDVFVLILNSQGRYKELARIDEERNRYADRENNQSCWERQWFGEEIDCKAQ